MNAAKLNSTDTQLEVILVLRNSFQNLRTQYPGYSLRRFSKKIGVASPIVSQVLNGKRKVTQKLGEQLLLRLDIESSRKHALICNLPKKRSRSENFNLGESVERTELSGAEFSMLADWWHFAILALLDSSEKVPNSKFIAWKFGITETQAKKSINTLRQLGLIERKNGFLRSTGKIFTTTTDVPSTLIQANHMQGLELASHALSKLPVQLRDYSSITVACEPRDLISIKKEIEKMRRRISSLMKSTKGRAVYRFQIQLFPLTEECQK